MSIRKDYSIDVLRLLENLKKDIGTKRNFGKLVFGLDKDEICFQIDQIRASMPREMKDAASLTRETERVLSSAEEEASALYDAAQTKSAQLLADAEQRAALIVQQAELKAQQLVQEDEITRIAKAQADELRKSAEKDAREMKRGADHYAADTLENLENVVGKVLRTIETGKRELQANIQPVDAMPTHAVIEVEKERVKA
jgi:vacuolar-type H+-ATPase subunit H